MATCPSVTLSHPPTAFVMLLPGPRHHSKPIAYVSLPSVKCPVKKEYDVVDKIKAAILKRGNQLAVEGEKLHNMITHAYIPDEYVALILNADATGQKLYEDYVSERIRGEVSLWAPAKKANNKMFMSANKETTLKLRDKTVDLKETKDLYGRLMVLARSSKDFNQKEAIGNHEFTVTPRALFASDGTMVPGSRTGFRVIPTSMTLNDLERRISPYFAFIFIEFDCFAGQLRYSG